MLVDEMSAAPFDLFDDFCDCFLGMQQKQSMDVVWHPIDDAHGAANSTEFCGHEVMDQVFGIIAN